MSEDNQSNQQENTADQAPKVDEMSLLKSRADMMGITYSNNIGLDALKAKIAAKLAGETLTNDDDLHPMSGLDQPVNPLEEPGTMPGMTNRQKMRLEQLKLVRLRITNLDPKKKDLPGEIYTVANEVIGTVRAFIPFGEVTEDGWHVPYILYQFMKDKRFLNIRTMRNRKTGQIQVTQSWAPEFSLEILEPLTKAQLEQLGQAQIAAGSLDMPGVEVLS